MVGSSLCTVPVHSSNASLAVRVQFLVGQYSASSMMEKDINGRTALNIAHE